MVRKESLNERDYLVVPMVMMVEGVHNGSRGPLLYTAEELGKYCHIWNTKPLVVNHTEGSACTPENLRKSQIGMVLNARMDGNRLCAEAWVDPSLAEKVEPRILTAISNKEVMEVSTGVFLEEFEEEGEWQGEAYKGIAKNHLPDHLAILPDSIGACSVEDGAGLCRNERKELEGMKDKLPKDFVNFLARHKLIENEVSHTAIEQMLREALITKLNLTPQDNRWIYILDVYSNFFIYEDEQEGRDPYRKLYRLGYSVANETVTIEGDPVEVVRVIEYRTKETQTFVGNTKPEIITNQNTDMNKKVLVDGLIATNAWAETKREFLMGLDETTLNELKVNAEANKPSAPESQIPATLNEFIESAPEAFKPQLAAMYREHEAKRAATIKKIVAHKKNRFTEEVLNTKPLEELEMISSFCEEAPAAKPSFAGASDPGEGDLATNEESEPLTVPALF